MGRFLEDFSLFSYMLTFLIMPGFQSQDRSVTFLAGIFSWAKMDPSEDFITSPSPSIVHLVYSCSIYPQLLVFPPIFSLKFWRHPRYKFRFFSGSLFPTQCRSSQQNVSFLPRSARVWKWATERHATFGICSGASCLRRLWFLWEFLNCPVCWVIF